MKKKLLICLSILLIAAMAITGTMAYFTDTDTDVNVMLFGNVDIEQIEQEWNEDQSALVDFTQLKPLFPYVGKLGWENTEEAGGAYRRFTMNNVIDKYVSVKNTGDNDAYVRTIIALEMGDYTVEEFNMIGVSINSANGSEFKFDGTWMWSGDFVTSINGHNYYVLVATHEKSIAPEEITIPSLLQVYLSKEADNEHVAKLDGNGNGTYDILVKSQAVQTAGFANVDEAMTEAFGTPDPAKVAEWFNGVKFPRTVANFDEATDGFADGGELFLIADVTGAQYTVPANSAVDFELLNYTFDGPIVNNGELIVNGGILTSDTWSVVNWGDATISNVTMNAGDPVNYALITKGDSAYSVFDNVDLNSAGGGVSVTQGATAVFNSGKVYVDTASQSGRYVFYVADAGSTLTINDGDFSWDKNDNTRRAYIYAAAGTTVYVNGGTFGKPSTRTDYKAGILGDGTVIITGGTFGFNPTNWVADGYTAVYADGVWTVSAN